MKNRLRQLREEAKLTQKELAVKLKLSKPTISKYEDGSVDMSTETLMICADIFDCSIDYILFRTDDKNIEILEGNKLPPELRGIIDAIGILKGTGLSNKDIQELLEAHARIQSKLNKS